MDAHTLSNAISAIGAGGFAELTLKNGTTTTGRIVFINAIFDRYVIFRANGAETKIPYEDIDTATKIAPITETA
ncbi:hypothetical protein [Actinomadura sp. K4S16]|uniref:hypothetical protein n=1 Tax=Actinomadura sp. K4S16 TaxID=1316147 RepID=UPI0011ED5271|nr:hypothetical protein [Actinomadura sp. K4S16]